MRTTLPVALLAATLASGEAQATDPETYTLRARTLARSGRIVSYAGLGTLSLGATLLPLSRVDRADYPDRDDFTDEAAYRRQSRRYQRSLGLFLSGVSFIGIGGPVWMVGSLMEGVALHRLYGTTMLPGWIGFGLFSAGAAIASSGAIRVAPYGAESRAGRDAMVAGLVVGAVGFLVTLGQYGVNEHTYARLSADDHRETYRPRFQAVVTPTVQAGGAGLAFAAVW
jgi:hypothetical protein